MKERPINLTAQEVKDALDVSHMTLRRLVKPQPPERFLLGDVAGITNGKRWAFSRIRGSFKEAWPEDPTPGFWCPLGQTRDRLWGRESWRVVGWHEGEPMYVEGRDGSRWEADSGTLDDTYDEWRSRVEQQCTDDCVAAGLVIDAAGVYSWKGGKAPTRWRSLVHMPRWASRILLEIEHVRLDLSDSQWWWVIDTKRIEAKP